MIYLDLFAQFALISVMAFGGGKASLPMIECISVHERRWITPLQFSAAVAFGYITPGPVLITATFIGHQAHGFFGAVAATVGVFLLPCVMAGLISHQLKRFAASKWLRSFGNGTASAIVGMLALLTVRQAQRAFGADSFTVVYAIMALCATLLAFSNKIHPSLIAIGCMVAGFIMGG